MTRSFIAFHMRDYQKDTLQLPLEGHGAYFLLLQYCWTHGRIPPDDASRAAICKVPVARWRRELAPLVAGYFDDNGENKRATIEIAKVEKMRTQRAMAGHHGGVKSAIQKAVKTQAVAQAAATATVKRPLQQPLSGSSSGREAIKKEKSISLTSTSLSAAREEESENPPESTPKASLAEPKSGLAMEESRSVFATSDDLKTSMLRKGWIA